MLDKILLLCKTNHCELHEQLDGTFYVQNHLLKNVTRSTKILSEILHDLRQYLQDKYPIKDNLDWLDDLGTFDYGKRTDIFNHLEYMTYSSLNKNRHYANDNGLYL